MSHNSKAITWEGVKYSSIKEAAKAAGIKYTTLCAWIRQGGRSTQTHEIPCEWNGVLYPSIKKAADANFITPVGMWFRRKNGYKSDDDMKKVKSRSKNE